MSITLCGAIVDEAFDYFGNHLVLCSSVSDCVPVDLYQAVDRSIREMFDLDSADTRVKHKVAERLWLELEGSAAGMPRNTDELYAEVCFALSHDLRRRFELRFVDVDAIIAKRADMAKDFQVHPDKALRLAIA